MKTCSTFNTDTNWRHQGKHQGEAFNYAQLSATASDSPDYGSSSYDGARCSDGNALSTECSSGNSANAWLQLDLGSSQPVNRVVVYGGNLHSDCTHRTVQPRRRICPFAACLERAGGAGVRDERRLPRLL